MRALAVAVLLLTTGLFVPQSLSAVGQQDERVSVLATTSWTAAFARAAGLSEIRILAPYEMTHPSEYELKPSDLQAVAEAELIIYAGYEIMVQRLKAAVGRSEAKLLQIGTDYSLATLRESIGKIAAINKTESFAQKSISEIAEMYEDWWEELRKAGVSGSPVLVHVFQKPLAEELGFEVKGVFGPRPLEARQIATLSENSVSLIIDNNHNPVAMPLRETLDEIPYVSFINFPASKDSGALLDVLRSNRRTLASAFSIPTE
jgi:zinc transport system substrate-binding protein